MIYLQLTRFLRLFPLLVIAATGVHAQWRTESYALPQGWSAIWLAGDATYASLDDLLDDAPEISQVWRWNPDPEEIQFITSPNEEAFSEDDWTVWKRDDPSDQGLRYLIGNSAYLIHSDAPTNWSLKYRVSTPDLQWLVNGANLLSFPIAASGSTSAPTFSDYFSSLIYEGATGLPPSVKIYKFIGGDMNSVSNPLAVPTSERMNAKTAYWISLPSASDFTGPIEFETSSDGVAFGRTQTTALLGVKNRTSTDLTLTLGMETSEEAPTGQDLVAGPVALSLRQVDAASGTAVDLSLDEERTVSIPASSVRTLELIIDRSSMASNPDDHYASILRVTDSAGLTDSRLPVTAQPTSPAGLWATIVTIDEVDSTQGGSPHTNAAFQMLYIVHIDGAGNARLLRRAFVGQSIATGNPMTIATNEDQILGAAEAMVAPRRFFSPMLPFGQPVVEASGTATIPGEVEWVVTHFHNDPVNPFVHAYHPDHDNLSADFKTTLPAGIESYDITRAIVFSFTTEIPETFSAAAGTVDSAEWGYSVFGGIYSETITGLMKSALSTRGVFLMLRLSEISTINLD